MYLPSLFVLAGCNSPPFSPEQVQIDPYLEDAMCQVCRSQPGPFFCRDQVTFLVFIPSPTGLK